MAQVTLSEPDQNALRALLAVEPVPGRPVPEARTYELLNTLVPCDFLGAGRTDLHGHTPTASSWARERRNRVVEVETRYRAVPRREVRRGPHYLGSCIGTTPPRGRGV